MAKLTSEGQFGAALRSVDLEIEVYKPPDDARNRKPCDFMAWYREGDGERKAAWFEVKDTDQLTRFPLAELRPSQLQGIRNAERVGLPYWLAVHWRGRHTWTISDAVRVLRWFEDEHKQNRANKTRLATSIDRMWLSSRYGIDSSPGQLASTLKSVLLGDV